MDLRAKLGLLNGLGRPPAGVATKPPPPVEAQPVAPEAAGGFMPPSSTRFGPVRLRDRVHRPGFRQGTVELDGARVVSGATLSRLALDEGLAGVEASKMLLVDTETTGLHGGAGTLPFLIGLGWFEGEALVVRQLFLERPGHERPMLELLADSLRQASVLVTFNGKCFDWPLLRTRLVMNRVSAPPVPPHLDLLHCARRVFKRRLPSTRLQDLEAHVLGFHRVGDLDGSLIPAVYFDWLRRGTTHLLERVLEHNVRDLVSMAAVLAELARRLEPQHADQPPEDALSVAELALRAGATEEAEARALAAAHAATRPDTALEAWSLAARLAGRRKAWSTVADRLSRALQVAGADPAQLAQVHLALSRVLEHHLKDRPRALAHARLGAAAEPALAHARRLTRLDPGAGGSPLLHSSCST